MEVPMRSAKIAFADDLFDYYYPENFHELVEAMERMDVDEWVDSYDSGNHRVVEIGYNNSGKYELYEDAEYLGCTHDVISAASFIAEGGEY